jgi:hypothetical protein
VAFKGIYDYVTGRITSMYKVQIQITDMINVNLIFLHESFDTAFMCSKTPH